MRSFIFRMMSLNEVVKASMACVVLQFMMESIDPTLKQERAFSLIRILFNIPSTFEYPHSEQTKGSYNKLFLHNNYLNFDSSLKMSFKEEVWDRAFVPL